MYMFRIVQDLGIPWQSNSRDFLMPDLIRHPEKKDSASALLRARPLPE
jgi:hypothetical protein